MLPEVIFTTSVHGNPFLKVGEFTYSMFTPSRTSACLKKRWVCSKWRSGCRATLYTVDHHIISMRNEHMHTSRRN
ncbi:hypothetical protein JYU34_004440 [Plutella xylostella]|uniref:FLYWCH-type domain-containing protein n=1 Tax=Plutella xylostella TaxID=51655 RepID=A0ABQ7QY11_PLUXY|nr:hypothetical protein JYU34_004440 [Plutella xylostella]